MSRLQNNGTRQPHSKMRLPMYDVRSTMYDCQIRARCAGKRQRMAAPMYDVGCTTRTTAVSQFGQKRSFCPAGVRSRGATPKQPGQGGAGESTWEILALARAWQSFPSCWPTCFIHRQRMRNGLNEPKEDFIGTREGTNSGQPH